MKIRSVTTSGLSGLADGSHSFCGASGTPLERVLITGPRASGKTRLLEAIVLAKELLSPYGREPSTDGWLGEGEESAKIEIEWDFNELERERVGLDGALAKTEVIIGGPFGSNVDQDPRVEALLGDYFHDPAFGKVDYFADNRELPSPGNAILLAAYGGDDVAAQKGLRLTRENAKYGGLTQLLLEASLGTHPALGPIGLDRIRVAFEELGPTKSLAGMIRGRSGFRPNFVDQAGASTDFEALTASERQALIFATTFLRTALSNSVVLIDTPELHLAEDEVLAFVSALERLGGGNQLVIATRSKALVASAGRNVLEMARAGRTS